MTAFRPDRKGCPHSSFGPRRNRSRLSSSGSALIGPPPLCWWSGASVASLRQKGRLYIEGPSAPDIGPSSSGLGRDHSHGHHETANSTPRLPGSRAGSSGARPERRPAKSFWRPVGRCLEVPARGAVLYATAGPHQRPTALPPVRDDVRPIPGPEVLHQGSSLFVPPHHHSASRLVGHLPASLSAVSTRGWPATLIIASKKKLVRYRKS